VILLVILAIGLGFLLSRMIPTIGEVQREMSLTPTPLPEVPDNVMAVTQDPSAPTPEPVLRTGSRGEEVKTLQSRLMTLGYYSDEIDGQFGGATKAAVMEFQLANGLEADGLVGSETAAVLYSPQAKPKTGE
jgi:peptidoglycan hydrolase-like protein with peptidoglycan-binding domain